MMTHMPETLLSRRFIPGLNSTTLSSISSTNLKPASSNMNLSQANSNISLNPVSSNTNPNPVNSSTSLNQATISTNLNLMNSIINPSPLKNSISLNPMNQPPVRLSRPRSHYPHLSLSPPRHEIVDPLPPPLPPLTLEDLATDSDS